MTTFYLVSATSIIFVIVMWLILRSGRGYSVDDTEAHASNYADVIKEGHGGLTMFLWVTFSAILIWSIVYFWIHGSEFAVIFSISG